MRPSSLHFFGHFTKCLHYSVNVAHKVSKVYPKGSPRLQYPLAAGRNRVFSFRFLTSCLSIGFGEMFGLKQHGQGHAGCPSSSSCCTSKSMLYVHIRAACPVHAACPCPSCKPVSMLYVHVHTACWYPCFMSMSMLHAHVNDTYMSMLYVLVDAASSCLCAMPSTHCVSMSILHALVYAAFPCPCCISMYMTYVPSMLHVHVDLYVKFRYNL